MPAFKICFNHSKAPTTNSEVRENFPAAGPHLDIYKADEGQRHRRAVNIKQQYFNGDPDEV